MEMGRICCECAGTSLTDRMCIASNSRLMMQRSVETQRSSNGDYFENLDLAKSFSELEDKKSEMWEISLL